MKSLQISTLYSVKNLLDYSFNKKYQDYDNLMNRYKIYQEKLIKKYLKWKSEYKTVEEFKKNSIDFIFTDLLTEDEILLFETFHKCNYKIKDIAFSLNIHRNTAHSRLLKMGDKVKFYLENIENIID